MGKADNCEVTGVSTFSIFDFFGRKPGGKGNALLQVS